METDTLGAVQEEETEEMSRCFLCENEFPTEDMREECGHEYCDDCYCETYTTCTSCDATLLIEGHHRHVGTAVYVDGEAYCEECYSERFFTCECCNRERDRDYAIITSGGDAICDRCYDRYYFTCDDCGEVFHNDDYGHDGRCESCCHEEDDRECVHEYSYEPMWETHRVSDEPAFYLGVELETEKAKLPEDMPSELIAKHDGSLDNSGIEFVSHPATLEYHKFHFAGMWGGPILDQRKHGAVSWDSPRCGMHVHTPSKEWTHLQLFKVLRFFRDNPNWIIAVSGRKTEQFQRWTAIDSSEGEASLDIKSKDRHKAVRDRYVAINLCNEKTIEFRIFRGTLNPDRFLANLEMIHGLWEYSKTADIGFTVKDFKAFMSSHTDLYPHFVSKFAAYHGEKE